MSHLQRTFRPGAALVVSFLCLLAPRGAWAWERDMHVSIVEAALQLSPAAEARIPNEYRDAFYHELGEADFLDKDCRYHASLTGNRDAAALAEKVLAEITNPARPLKPYPRAQALGRYAHYVADSIVPSALKGENVPNKLPNFFANRNFVLYREARPLTMPISVSLRERATGVLWPSNQDAGSSMIFRLAVNTMIEAFMLLPPRPGTETVADVSPVIFVVNRMDNGLAAKRTEGYVKTAKTTQMDSLSMGPYQWVTTGSRTTYSWSYEAHGGGESSKKSNIMEQSGVQIVEMNVHQKAEGSTLRVLLFNNADNCAANVSLKMGTAWKWALPEVMPPRALRMIEVELPESLASRRLTSSYTTEQCAGKIDTQAFLMTNRRLVVGNTGTPPRFLGVTPEISLSETKGTSRPVVQSP
ncbi:MAG: hypothetical protein ABIT01_06980 [Thermoanaerobaculia bacterium]